jgi:hypothetical protein
MFRMTLVLEGTGHLWPDAECVHDMQPAAGELYHHTQ